MLDALRCYLTARILLNGLAALCMLIGSWWSDAADAHMVATPVSWTFENVRFRSLLVYDDAIAARRPGLLMVPAWFGVNDTAIRKAEDIAGQRYVILLTDMYGETIRPRNSDEAHAATKPLLSDRRLMRRRINFALARLRGYADSAPIDPTRMAAIGFCFGGAAVLDLARSGADISSAISFHGNLTTDDPDLAKQIRARVLVMNGADDATTSPDFSNFMQEMRQSPAPWEFTVIGHAVHCFTETEATASSGLCRYDAHAAAQSYSLMSQWLKDGFSNTNQSVIRSDGID
ncbi:dienelactone hydrolase [Acetobacter nitrogenifigens DSM 23921 = NBRC 105050]|uniref:DeoR family transcriptional regulator n=1 Tax=Acetobacter nitrogenifigens DSM 23921 = NBRC 105050 TaxID=1120919 RepID=A0A511XBV5_9PROT|nr:dienelactone hydrolase family protein [Acetobacter nitrogenifigens]GBQ88608.1 dienelactone hydrolase [Acetobacter nitrogenifigens DSM 23921 = NBRC 105050]GEN60448.1 DeoR family transcriptional regulator [Acetobacter nitrogenifigens DSM 23921 = NBRC 105050]